MKLLVGALLIVLAAGSALAARMPAAPPEALVREWRLSPFYKQHLDAGGFPILASERPSGYALCEARYLIDQMLQGRGDVRQALVRSRVRFTVMAYDEMTTAVPEHSDLTPALYWDRRARGLGATRSRPSVSCGEENLLEYPGDPYRGENILIHEFSHAMHQMGLQAVEPDFNTRLKAAYDAAKEKGLWKGTYALTNMHEYWAEGVQSFFDCNQKPNASHNEVDTREELEAYDPALAGLIRASFKNTAFRYVRPSARKEKAHLAGYDPAQAPRFTWPERLKRQ